MKKLRRSLRKIFMSPVAIPLCLLLAVFGCLVHWNEERSYKIYVVSSMIRFCWNRYIAHFLTCVFWAYLVAKYLL
jgi:hypothetical protein